MQAATGSQSPLARSRHITVTETHRICLWHSLDFGVCMYYGVCLFGSILFFRMLLRSLPQLRERNIIEKNRAILNPRSN